MPHSTAYRIRGLAEVPSRVGSSHEWAPAWAIYPCLKRAAAILHTPAGFAQAYVVPTVIGTLTFLPALWVKDMRITADGGNNSFCSTTGFNRPRKWRFRSILLHILLASAKDSPGGGNAGH